MEKTIDIFALSMAEIDYQISRLSPGQVAVISYLAQGKIDKDIAAILGIGVNAVYLRLTNACDRVGVKKRAQLIALYAVWYWQKNKGTGKIYAENN